MDPWKGSSVGAEFAASRKAELRSDFDKIEAEPESNMADRNEKH
jgi:hypothetical protein